MKNDPALPIEVDSETGVWQTDGLPMLYVPRHFFVNNHDMVEEAMGKEEYAKILYVAGHKSAHHWCEHESKQHELKGMDVFSHYLQRLSLRGWGLFSFLSDDIKNLPLSIRLDHSAFVLNARKFPNKSKEGELLCHMFAGWFAGAADWVAQNEGLEDGFVCSETQCANVCANVCANASDNGAGNKEGQDFCLYEVKYK